MTTLQQSQNPLFVMLIFLVAIAYVIAAIAMSLTFFIKLIERAYNSYQTPDIHYQQTKILFAKDNPIWT